MYSQKAGIFGHLIYKRLMIAFIFCKYSVSIVQWIIFPSHHYKCKASPNVLCKPCVNCIVLWSMKFYIKMLIVTTSFFLGYLWVSNHVLNETYCTVYRCLVQCKWWKQTACPFKCSLISGVVFVYLLRFHISMATDLIFRDSSVNIG